MFDRTAKVQDQEQEQPLAKATAARGEPASASARTPVWSQALPPQAKLTVNQPGDAYEQEADRVAEQVTTARDAAEPMPTGAPAVSPAASPVAGPTVQSKPADSSGGPPAPPVVHQALQSPGQPLDPATRHALEPRLGQDFGDVRVHTDPAAAQSANAVHARAYTVGRDVVFAEGQYAPQTAEGQRLLAHELTHVVQQGQGAARSVQRDVIEMEPITVRSTLQPVERAVPGLGSLTGQGVTPGQITMEHGEESVRRNAPDPTQRLPFRAGGWDGDDILTRLGQYDTVPGTDSDALRCVQAVAMASRIPRGPSAVIHFLRAMILEGMISRPPNQRQRTAIDVLEHVIGRIETQRATFGDLLWAQEALHDLFYNDVSGTPQADIRGQVVPTFDLETRLERMDVWCNSPTEVIAQARALQPGEQLLVNTWEVVFNVAFDELSEQGIEVAEGDSIWVRVNGRQVRIRRISTATRPPHTAIDPLVRDRSLGHQLLVFKDGATGAMRLYEPEITASGRHLETLANDGSNFERYFRDLPDIGVYNYIQILGKLTPTALASLATAAATP